MSLHICKHTIHMTGSALLYAQFVHSRWRTWVGGSASLCRALVAGAGRYFSHKQRWRFCMCFSLFLDGDESVRWCMCVYTHTHTHTHMGSSDVSPGVGTRHLEGPNNPDGLNLDTCVFVYVYQVHTCICMLGGGMRCWADCFFHFNIFFLPQKKNKRCKRNIVNSNQYGFELHRPSIKGTKLLFKVVKGNHYHHHSCYR